MTQTIFAEEEKYDAINLWISKNGIKRILIVCGSSINKQEKLKEYVTNLEYSDGISISYFMNFEPNPSYESVTEGIQLYRKKKCDSILAIGGGSAIDVAKCIKKYNKANLDSSFIDTDYHSESIPFMAIPTTAGSGSEVTKFAVIYYKGQKQSITDENIKPNVVLLDGTLINSLPLYQKKATMMDAFCHALESFWSINSTDISKKYSADAIKRIFEFKDLYLANNSIGNRNMLNASNIAGKAIDIAQTTAGHAMSYKITSLFGISHGHAVGLCNKVLFDYLISNTSRCKDIRGELYLNQTLGKIAEAFGCNDIFEAKNKFTSFFDELELDVPKPTKDQYDLLKSSVNQERLKNYPVILLKDDIDELYHCIFRDT